MHSFTYLYKDPCGQVTTNLASWEILHLEPELEEIRVRTGRNTFDVILGSGFFGKFVYFPGYCFGFPVNNLEDADICQNHMSQKLASNDAAAIAAALKIYVSCNE